MNISVFNNFSFYKLQDGVYGDDSLSVMISEDGSFAYLDPIPVMNYQNYITRNEKLGLQKQKNNEKIAENRFNKIKHLFKNSRNVCEIGAGSGFFLEYIANQMPSIELYSIEQDQNTLESRSRFVKHSNNFLSIDQVVDKNISFDLILMHHVLEHIIEPDTFLVQIKALMHKNSILVIEVPSLSDPLLTLYKNFEYKKFFYQVQHPYYYSMNSLEMLAESHSFTIMEKIHYQRYGLDNHMHWNMFNKPGLYREGGCLIVSNLNRSISMN